MGKKNKKGCVFLKDWLEIIEVFSDKATRCDLYEAILKYALDGEKPELPSQFSLFWESIKPEIDENRKVVTSKS